MTRTCIRAYGNKVLKYLCAEVCAERLESGLYRFTDMADVRKLVEISGTRMSTIRTDCFRGCIFLVRETPSPSGVAENVSVAMSGDVFLFDMASRELKAASRRFFERNYKVIEGKERQ